MFFKPFIINMLAADAKIANPAVPLTIIGLGIVAILFVVYRKARREKKKRNKYLIKDSTFDVEVQASEEKRNIKRKLDEYCKSEHYNYTSGYIPGHQPELSFIDAARRGEPIERIRVKETYAPEMIIPKSEAKEVKGKSVANPYNLYASKKPSPIMTQPTLPPTPPILTPVQDESEIKMPNLTPVAPVIPTPTAGKIPYAPISTAIPTAPIGEDNEPKEKPKSEKKVKAAKEKKKPREAVESKAAPVAQSEPAPELQKAEKTARPTAKKGSGAKQIPIVAPIAVAKNAAKKSAPVKVEPPVEPAIAMSAPIEKISEAVYGKPDLHRVTINQTPVSFAKVPVRRVPKKEYSVLENEVAPIESRFSDVEGVVSDFEEPDLAVEVLVQEQEHKTEESAPVDVPVQIAEPETVVPEPMPEPEAVPDVPVAPVQIEAEPAEEETPEEPATEPEAISEEPTVEPSSGEETEDEEDVGMPTVEEYNLPTASPMPELPKKEAKVAKPVKKKPAAKKPAAKANPVQSQAPSYPGFGDYSNYFSQFPSSQPTPVAKSVEEPKMPEQTTKTDESADTPTVNNVVVIKIPDEIKEMYKLNPKDLGLED